MPYHVFSWILRFSKELLCSNTALQYAPSWVFHSLKFWIKDKRSAQNIWSKMCNFDSCFCSCFALLMQSNMRKSQMQDCGNDLGKIRHIIGQYLRLESSPRTIKSLILANQLTGAGGYLVAVLFYNHICIKSPFGAADLPTKTCVLWYASIVT